MNTIQEKLATVFSEHFQIKRVKKQIQHIHQNKQKYNYDAKMLFSRGQNVSFHIILLKGALKKYKKLSNIQNFQIKIILKRQYPAQAPFIYCMSDSMIDFGLEPFRDYSQFVCSQWSAKFTILDIIKIFPEFIDNWKKQSQQLGKRGNYRENESFQADRIFSWSFLQTFPVRFLLSNSKTDRIGLLVISNQKQLIFLQQSQQVYLTRDILPMRQLISIFKSLQRTGQIMLEIKPIQKEQSNKEQKLSIRFRSDDSQNIVNYIIEYMKIANTMTGKSLDNNNNSSGNPNQQQHPLSSQSQQQYQSDSLSQSQPKQSSSPSKINIEAIKQEIIIYQNQVENNMTSQNVSNLVLLLKKAIQYYSAIGKEDFQIYLDKLKTLLSNQMAQVLLDSLADKSNGLHNRRGGQDMVQQKNTQNIKYPSIFDFL